MLGDDASTAEATPDTVERDEQGEARRANTTPNDGPHLELGRLCRIDMYPYVRVRIESWDILIKNRKQHPSQGDGASTAETTPGRVGRDEQGEARRANTTQNGRPHLELGRLRLETWSKSGFSIAETTWPTHLYIHLQGRLRRGGLTPALAPRMPGIAENVLHVL